MPTQTTMFGIPEPRAAAVRRAPEQPPLIGTAALVSDEDQGDALQMAAANNCGFRGFATRNGKPVALFVDAQGRERPHSLEEVRGWAAGVRFGSSLGWTLVALCERVSLIGLSLVGRFVDGLGMHHERTIHEIRAAEDPHAV